MHFLRFINEGHYEQYCTVLYCSVLFFLFLKIRMYASKNRGKKTEVCEMMKNV